MRLLSFATSEKKIQVQVIYPTARVVDYFISPENISLFHFSDRENKSYSKDPKK